MSRSIHTTSSNSPDLVSEVDITTVTLEEWRRQRAAADDVHVVRKQPHMGGGGRDGE